MSLRYIVFALSALLISACATVDYASYSESDLDEFQARRFSRFAERLREAAEKPGPDQLLFQLDRALALHAAGAYAQSNEQFWEAAKITRIKGFDKDTELRSMYTRNTKRKLYHGEEFEDVMVSVYQAINYALLKKDEDGILESLRAFHKIVRLNNEGERGYTPQPLWHYLAAMLYERQGNWLSAYKSYKLAYEANPSLQTVYQDLLRAAVRIRSDMELAHWRSRLDRPEHRLRQAYKSLRDDGSVIVVYENGYVGEKQQSTENREVVEFKPGTPKHRRAWVVVNGREESATEMALNVDQLARENYIAKQRQFQEDLQAGRPTEELKQEREKAKDLTYRGTIAKTSYLQADLRHWKTLPRNLQLARIFLPVGKHRIQLRLERHDGRKGVYRDLGELAIRSPGEMHLLHFRSLND